MYIIVKNQINILYLRCKFNIFKLFGFDDFFKDIAAVAEAGIIETPSVQNDDDCCDMVLAMVSR